jgi:glycosyltransferase involved in cell wall biosynthesis
MGGIRTPLVRERKLSKLRDELAIRRKELKARTLGRTPRNPKFSIVSAVYNVEKYLEDYFTSIVLQPEFLDQIQVIVVNDGSTDHSLDILNSWQRRFPHNITVVSQENGGQASARNHGMKYASGEWITFIDPDDFVERDYFRHIRHFIDLHDPAGNQLQFISCNMIFYRENSNSFDDTHPLRFRFVKSATLHLNDLGRHIQLSVNSVLFRRSTIENSQLLFDPRVRPSFEDGHFVARLLLACSSGIVGFNAKSKYYYRKRADLSSAIDTSRADPRRYGDLFEYGYIDIFRHAAAKSGGVVPTWLQRTVLYDLTWQLKEIVDHEERLSFLGRMKADEYLAWLRSAFSYIDAEVIREFELAGIFDLIRLGMLRFFKGETGQPSSVIVDAVDTATRTIVIRWFSVESSDHAAVFIDGKRTAAIERGSQSHTLINRAFAYENRVRVRGDKGWMSVRINDQPMTIRCPGTKPSQRLSLESITTLRKQTHQWTVDSVQDIRRVATEPSMRRRYANCWLLMDRDTQADDNAEHLYRYISKNRPEVNAYFVLRRSSHDWDRLASEGFRLIDFHSPEHDAALLNADFLISSHADSYLFARWPDHQFGDLLRYRFIFLQHGVIKHDLSHWLNRRPISLMVTSTHAEHESLVGAGTRCKFLPSQVTLSGLPRHDALLKRIHGGDPQILVAPTWRRWLVNEPGRFSSERGLVAEFMETDYAIAWGDFLRSERLRDILQRYNFRLVFFPHSYIQPYIDWFHLPSHITTADHTRSGSIQELLGRSRLLISDYSSIDSDMAYLMRGTLYYHFDRERMFGGSHTYGQGYFDYDRDGFGPVSFDLSSLLDAVERTLSNDGEFDEEYVVRMLRAFQWRDGRCCERVIEAIDQLGKWRTELPASISTAQTEPEFDVHWAARRGAKMTSLPHAFPRMKAETLSSVSLRECGF